MLDLARYAERTRPRRLRPLRPLLVRRASTGPHATDAFATLAGLARETSRIELVVLVSPITFRHPAVIAKMAATIDEMSGGPPRPRRRHRLDGARAHTSSASPSSTRPSGSTGSRRRSTYLHHAFGQAARAVPRHALPPRGDRGRSPSRTGRCRSSSAAAGNGAPPASPEPMPTSTTSGSDRPSEIRAPHRAGPRRRGAGGARPRCAPDQRDDSGDHRRRPGGLPAQPGPDGGSRSLGRDAAALEAGTGSGAIRSAPPTRLAACRRLESYGVSASTCSTSDLRPDQLDELFGLLRLAQEGPIAAPGHHVSIARAMANRLAAGSRSSASLRTPGSPQRTNLPLRYSAPARYPRPPCPNHPCSSSTTCAPPPRTSRSSRASRLDRRPRRDPCPDGPQRVRQVHPRQRPDGPPRLRDHRRAGPLPG